MAANALLISMATIVQYKLASRVERLATIVERTMRSEGDNVPAITWQSGGHSHTFPAQVRGVSETADQFRARYIGLLDADMKAFPVDP